MSDGYETVSGTQVSRRGDEATVVVHRLGLEVIAGPSSGRSVSVRGTRLRVGATTGADLVLDDPEISRAHFEIRAEPRGYEIVDLESTNGTFVDGVRVYRAALAPGAEITAGTSRLVFQPKKRFEAMPPSAATEFFGLVGRSRRMREVAGALARIAPTELSVLLLGESGTGKEVAARAIHRASPRAPGPLVVVDCAAISPALAESELFGHRRGAFTGAERDRAGSFETADGGVVFLDEIGELPLDLQPKLLRALEQREVKPVGGNETVGFDVRIVAATHRDLWASVRAGRFREDLYFRLAEVTVTLPPLREREDDIELLVRALTDREGIDARWTDGALARLREHPFAGNVRELRNTIRRAAAFAPGPAIDRDAVATALRDAPGATGTGDGFEDLLERPYREARDAAVERFERAYLARLVRAGESLREAAQRARIHRKSLERLLRKHDWKAEREA